VVGVRESSRVTSVSNSMCVASSARARPARPAEGPSPMSRVGNRTDNVAIVGIYRIVGTLGAGVGTAPSSPRYVPAAGCGSG
jgi:hypothetical protein